MPKSHANNSFVLCIENQECDDLEIGKVYAVLSDAKARREGYVRILDESDEDYLYPESYFVAVEIPPKARDVISAAS